MTTNRLGELMRGDQPVLGLANIYPAPGIIECMCKGWDFVWIDAQHGEMSYDSVMAALRTAMAIGIETVLRVPAMDPWIIGMYADAAPSALMVPMVNTADQARGLVEALRFPPRGVRSYGGRRIGDLYGREYYRERQVILMPQIETAEGAKNAEAIAAVDGVDCLFFGATDLKLSLGLPLSASDIQEPRVRTAMQRTVDAARAAGKWAGCMAYERAIFDVATEMGYRMFCLGVDVAFLRSASAQKLAEYRQAPKPVA